MPTMRLRRPRDARRARGLQRRAPASGLEPIGIGVGLNTGSLMLGTIGEKHRMDGTVISDAVNRLSRIRA
jgi:class 3 adenylate cyclase